MKVQTEEENMQPQPDSKNLGAPKNYSSLRKRKSHDIIEVEIPGENKKGIDGV